ncbi:MAG: 30S ribosome-binding factor RbfA [Omnitrophica bacterium]|nr:30S ribosome-binding factor RbfA [Candidatus Omnitrophota bacterium]
MSRRSEKIAESIRRLASEIIQNKLRDPRIKGFITITRVEVTPDLRLAKIYYSVLGDENRRKRVAYGLKSARSFMRGYIADELKMRYATDIMFKFDSTLEHKERISEILDRLHREAEGDGDKKNKESD